MQYLIVFLEGIITFLSPCLLPLLPVYLSYFAGGDLSAGRQKTLRSALGFVCGFTVMFLMLGGVFGGLGSTLRAHQTVIDLITGAVVVVFGLSFLGLFSLRTLTGGLGSNLQPTGHGFFSSVLFGLVFSIGWTPCVGALLGSALMLASQNGSALQGMLMLLCYSLGLGIPFLVSALVIDSLKGAFQFVKQHYTMINRISGAFLIIVGVAMMTGLMGRLLTALSR